ncbi:MAG: hypothetical protein ABSG14_07190, partial [Verrucomicrobiia bacterium]
IHTEIKQNGSYVSSGAGEVAMDTWDYRRTVLRQDEVASFIRDTKGGKYSALLPLLGLHEMEVSAENLRQLAKSVEQQSKLKEAKIALNEVDRKRKASFGTDGDEQILRNIGGLHTKYCADKAVTKDALGQCKDLQTALDLRVAQFSADQKRYLALQATAELKLKDQVEAVRSINVKLATGVEPLITEKLEVLQSTSAFVDKLGDAKDVTCPACGQPIPVTDFQAHVKAERERLQEIIGVFDERKAAIASLCDTLKSTRLNLGKKDVKAWREMLAEGPLAASFSYLDEVNVEALRTSCGEDALEEIASKLLPLIDAATTASRNVPPDVQQLSSDQQKVAAGEGVIAAREQVAAVASAGVLISFVESLERGVRDEIRSRSQAVIDNISADVQTMWKLLHPGEPIENVRLYVPEEGDKAIDIGLKFHGVDQDSPRLTLSEGYRNSLGLCIFLAMAKRGADRDHPLFLDDVVVSLDRSHRGMIVELLEKHFSDRQVVVLTHDREWYTELRQQLDDKAWAFKALLPYESPQIGIRWSYKTTTFDDARAQLRERPDSAGNDVRKIMDVELSLIAERLQISLPYLRADKNDKRTGHEFLERLTANGKQRFQKRIEKNYVAHTDAILALDAADRLLVTWANRGSHTFDIVHAEANKLIDACENALKTFKCSSCGKSVWFADAESSKCVQCQCGEIRWRYGKG